jgi:hypothetical protein
MADCLANSVARPAADAEAVLSVMTLPAAMPQAPPLQLGVLLQRKLQHNRWQRWSWSLLDVLPDEANPDPVDAALARAPSISPRCLAWGEVTSQWLYPGHCVKLHRDEVEGYHLNLISPSPSWFVWWSAPAEPDCDDPRQQAAGLPQVQAVTLSYNEAARWMDAGETVEIAALPGEVANWLADFNTAYYKPEPRKRRRPQSFLAPQERDATRLVTIAATGPGEADQTTAAQDGPATSCP